MQKSLLDVSLSTQREPKQKFWQDPELVDRFLRYLDPAALWTVEDLDILPGGVPELPILEPSFSRQEKKLSSTNYGYIFLTTEREVENFLVLA